MALELKISQPWYGLVETGDKTVEVKIDSLQWKNVEKGDILKLCHANKYVMARINQVHRYKNLLEAWQEHGNNLLPDCEDIEEAQTVFSQYYAPVDVQHNGIVCFEFEILV